MIIRKFIKLRKFLIIDGVHTENTEGYGCPQADFVGKRQLSSIGQQLKEKYFFNCRYIAGNCCSRKRVGGLWSAIAINDQQLKEKNIYPRMTRRDTEDDY